MVHAIALSSAILLDIFVFVITLGGLLVSIEERKSDDIALTTFLFIGLCMVIWATVLIANG